MLRNIWAYLLHQSQSAGISDGRGRVGHRTHHRHSSCQSSCRTRGEVLLMCSTRLPQMNMDVDQAWKSVRKDMFLPFLMYDQQKSPEKLTLQTSQFSSFLFEGQKV